MIRNTNLSVMVLTYRSKDHVQRHGNIEVERIIVANADHKEHRHQRVVRRKRNVDLGRSTASREDESLEGDEKELQEGDQIARTRIGSRNINSNNY